MTRTDHLRHRLHPRAGGVDPRRPRPVAGSSRDPLRGLIEFEANGYPTDATVRRIEQEIDYQRAVQAYIHYLPAVSFMQWRNGHFGPLGGKAGDMIIYRTTEQKLPILTPNDTTTYIATWAELSDFGGLLMYEVPAGPTGGLINDLWQRVVRHRHGRPGSRPGRQVPGRARWHRGPREPRRRLRRDVEDQHGAHRHPHPDAGPGGRRAHPQRAQDLRLGQESKIRIFEAPNRNWWNYQPRGMEYWKVVHQAIQLNPVEERDMAVLQGLKNLGLEKGKPFTPPTRRRNAGGGGARRRDLGDGQQLPEARSRQTLGGRSEVPVAVHPLHAEPARPDGEDAHGDRCAERLHLRGCDDVRRRHHEPRRRRHPVPRRLQGRRRQVAGRRQGL
jgi:hypothetical protein